MIAPIARAMKRTQRPRGALAPTPSGSVYVPPQQMDWQPSQFEGI